MEKDTFKSKIKILKEQLSSTDIEFIPVSANGKKGELIFINNIVDKKAIGDLILSPIADLKENLNEKELFEYFLSPEKKQVENIEEAVNEVLNGNAVLIVENVKTFFSFGLQKFDKRSIAEPPTSTVIKGPREGFVESLPVNISLLRRRIKSASLQIDSFTCGKYSKTPVALYNKMFYPHSLYNLTPLAYTKQNIMQ